MSGRLGAALIAVLSAGCGGAAEGRLELSAQDRAAVELAVDSALQAFLAAELAIDTTAVMAHMWPEFSMYQDGQRADYPTIMDQIRTTMPGLEVFHAEWTDIQIRALGAHVAVSSFHFRDSIVTLQGDLIQAQGPTTLIWERREDQWRLIYGDADHYPVEATESRP